MEDVSPRYEILKVDARLGLVFGWGIICKSEGEDYFDLHGDHVSEDEAIKGLLAFVEAGNVLKVMHEGDEVGSVVFAFPLTTDVAKALFGQAPSKTGVVLAAKPHPSVMKRFVSGELSGFSLGGTAKRIPVTDDDGNCLKCRKPYTKSCCQETP
jgi:hypothetical protein